MSTSAIFSGSSRFSDDFQQVLQRAVGIASLPLTQMQQQRMEAAGDLAAIQSVTSLVRGLKGTLSSIGDSLGKNPWKATVSDSTAVKATVSDGAMDGAYSLEVVSLGVATTRLTNAPAAESRIIDPSTQTISQAGTFTFKIDDADDANDAPTVISITPDSKTLAELAATINEKAGQHVQATVVNVGTTAAPDYRLSLKTNSYGNFNITLDDGSGNLLDTSTAAGSKVQYKVAGLSTVLQSTSRTVTLAPGLKVDLLKAESGKAVSIAVARSTDGFTTEMQSFVQNYNNTVNEIGNQSATGAALAGDSVVSSVRHMLREVIVADPGGSGFRSMAELGIEFTQQGTITFNRSVFDEAVKGKFDELAAFMGTTTESGTGFVKRAFDKLTGLEDTSSGILGLTITSLQESDERFATRIEAEQRRIDELTVDIQERLTKADAAIALLEQQATFFTGMIQAMRTNQESMNG